MISAFSIALPGSPVAVWARYPTNLSVRFSAFGFPTGYTVRAHGEITDPHAASARRVTVLRLSTHSGGEQSQQNLAGGTRSSLDNVRIGWSASHRYLPRSGCTIRTYGTERWLRTLTLKRLPCLTATLPSVETTKIKLSHLLRYIRNATRRPHPPS
jgi:hypothetical protein